MLTRLQSLPRDSRDTLFLLAVIAWVLMPQVPHLPWWCSVMAAGMLLWRGTLAFANKPLPGKWWLLVLLGMAVGATLLTHKTLLGRDAGVTLIVILLALKTLELRARRDAFVVFFLGFFTMLTNFFYSQSLLTAFSMLLGLLGLLTALVNAHMPVGKPPLLQAARTAGWMALLGAPVMVVLFLLFPRLAPLWGTPSDAMTGRSGLSATMQVGTIASLALDSSIAMRIAFQGPPPPQRELYFRGPVLSTFDGRQWLASSESRFPSRYKLDDRLSVEGAALSYQVTLEPTNRPWLFVMEAAAESPVVPGYRTRMSSELQWFTDRPVTDLLRYQVRSHPVFRHGPVSPEVGLQEFVELPPGFNPRTLALAAEIRRDPRYAQADSRALVQVAMDRLRSGGYVYTLEPGVYGVNTADEFWFDRKQGFCEHIASSFVVLMRAMDVPARLVTGYQGGELNSVDGFWVLRQSDALAWAEVWQAGEGWVRVDPTSAVSPGRTGAFQRLATPQGIVGQTLGNLNPNLSAQLRAAWEAVNNRWNQWVLNYTQGKQLDLLKNIGFESPSWEDLSYVLIAIVVGVSAGGAVWAWWDKTQHDPWLRLLERARRRLGRAGLSSHAASSPRQLAQQVLAQRGSEGQDIHDWLMQLEAQRYADATGPGAGAGISLARLKKQYAGLRWPV
ncbi:MAG: transglutaminase family protein [Polaromonas sp.]|uniref:transglutaminase family protein n=1 Tax=Polaromonas sp. TaxID=1869339 RepID=UPI00403549B2